MGVERVAAGVGALREPVGVRTVEKVCPQKGWSCKSRNVRNNSCPTKPFFFLQYLLLLNGPFRGYKCPPPHCFLYFCWFPLGQYPIRSYPYIHTTSVLKMEADFPLKRW